MAEGSGPSCRRACCALLVFRAPGTGTDEPVRDESESGGSPLGSSHSPRHHPQLSRMTVPTPAPRRRRMATSSGRLYPPRLRQSREIVPPGAREAGSVAQDACDCRPRGHRLLLQDVHRSPMAQDLRRRPLENPDVSRPALLVELNLPSLSDNRSPQFLRRAEEQSLDPALESRHEAVRRVVRDVSAPRELPRRATASSLLAVRSGRTNSQPRRCRSPTGTRSGFPASSASTRKGYVFTLRYWASS